MKRLIAGATVGLAGGVIVGLVGMSTPSMATNSQDVAAFKRKDNLVALLMAVDDVDDDDTFGVRADNSRDTSWSKTTRGTGSSRSRRDWTNSRYSPLSRDRDYSRGDKTRDFTYDGPGGKKRDWSRNHTNDRSKNDTRRGARA